MNETIRIYNINKNTKLRQSLRCDMPEAEKKLWQHIRKKQLGIKFRRQHGIGRYIADFYCSEHKLVIELDGDSHNSLEAQTYDKERNMFMRQVGLNVLRFTNQEVFTNIEGILEQIKEQMKSNRATPP
ncbi:endonuclease domain-containing protein [Moritella marina]|uniref:endonuclease domain-containing protein n=1 Tax=Moritella marina TaxID=90736 RepID=UPI00370497FA